MKKRYYLLLLGLILVVLLSAGCSEDKEVVVYTSVDQVHSEPVIKAFEEETGIKVKAVYDIEASKTVGLANRLVEEKDRPAADVFWNGEVSQTMRLIDLDVVEEDSFVEFGGRGRVIIYRTDMITEDELPKTTEALAAPEFGAEDWAMAYPMFGTSSTQAAALYAIWGPEKGKEYYETLDANGVTLVDGNSVVKDFVSEGRVPFGLTDTDDAEEGMSDNENLDIMFLDQDGMGAFVIPNTVTIIKDAPHPEEAQVFIDFLQSDQAQEMMYDSGWLDPNIADIKSLEVDWLELYHQLEPSKNDMEAIFAR